MNQKRRLITVGAIGIITIMILSSIWEIIKYLMVFQKAKSVGIIRGADGPTAVFMTAPKISMIWLGVRVVILIALIMIAIWGVKKYKSIHKKS